MCGACVWFLLYVFHSVLTIPRHSCDYRLPRQAHLYASVSASNGNLATHQKKIGISFEWNQVHGLASAKDGQPEMCFVYKVTYIDLILSHTHAPISIATSNVFLSSFKSFGCTNDFLAV